MHPAHPELGDFVFPDSLIKPPGCWRGAEPSAHPKSWLAEQRRPLASGQGSHLAGATAIARKPPGKQPR